MHLERMRAKFAYNFYTHTLSLTKANIAIMGVLCLGWSVFNKDGIAPFRAAAYKTLYK